jgi:hypothetical protein
MLQAVASVLGLTVRANTAFLAYTEGQTPRQVIIDPALVIDGVGTVARAVGAPPVHFKDPFETPVEC